MILVVSKVITHSIPRALVGLKSKYRGKDVIAKIPWTIQTGEIVVKSKIPKKNNSFLFFLYILKANNNNYPNYEKYVKLKVPTTPLDPYDASVYTSTFLNACQDWKP